MTEQELYNEYRKSDCKSFTDFLINKISELKKTYRKQRNKRIDELQKENARLTTNEKSLIAERKIIVKENAEAKNLIEELEKENAELKKKNLDTQDAVTMQMYTNKANKEIADKQLTKAKVALRNVIDYLGQFCSDYPDCVIEAEQFLNSEVEK